MNGILRNWNCLRDIRLDYYHHFDVIGTSNAMFDELSEKFSDESLGRDETYVFRREICY